jgi:hypothetical protein
VVAQVPGTVPLDMAASVRAMYANGGQVGPFLSELTLDRAGRARGEEPRYVTFDPAPEFGLGSEHAEYWASFGEAERRNWNPRVTLRSFEPSLAVDLTARMPAISPIPLLMVLAEDDTMYAFQRQAFEAAGEPKSLVVLPGHHYSVYGSEKKRALGAALDWFAEHLVQ